MKKIIFLGALFFGGVSGMHFPVSGANGMDLILSAVMDLPLEEIRGRLANIREDLWYNAFTRNYASHKLRQLNNNNDLIRDQVFMEDLVGFLNEGVRKADVEYGKLSPQEKAEEMRRREIAEVERIERVERSERELRESRERFLNEEVEREIARERAISEERARIARIAREDEEFVRRGRAASEEYIRRRRVEIFTGMLNRFNEIKENPSKWDDFFGDVMFQNHPVDLLKTMDCHLTDLLEGREPLNFSDARSKIPSTETTRLILSPGPKDSPYDKIFCSYITLIDSRNTEASKSYLFGKFADSLDMVMKNHPSFLKPAVLLAAIFWTYGL
jgi:hypothetical protein